jgi:hypothetical protein
MEVTLACACWKLENGFALYAPPARRRWLLAYFVDRITPLSSSHFVVWLGSNTELVFTRRAGFSFYPYLPHGFWTFVKEIIVWTVPSCLSTRISPRPNFAGSSA